MLTRSHQKLLMNFHTIPILHIHQLLGVHIFEFFNNQKALHIYLDKFIGVNRPCQILPARFWVVKSNEHNRAKIGKIIMTIGC